jgi:hypothetical protein
MGRSNNTGGVCRTKAIISCNCPGIGQEMEVIIRGQPGGSMQSLIAKEQKAEMSPNRQK